MSKPKGFAAMPPEQQRRISSLGGRSVAPEKRTFSTDNHLAREAGRRGGLRAQADRRKASA
jgi:general stress protein YciG